MSSTPRQLVFDLAHRAARGRGDYLVAPSNLAAVEWLDRWPEWPACGLVIHGPKGCGKTHLAAVWQAQSGAAILSVERIAGRDPFDVIAPDAAYVLDDVDCARESGRVDDDSLLHAYNVAVERRAWLLLTARTAPKRWTVALPDLASRLSALPAVSVGAPEDELVAGLVLKLFADRQIAIDPDVVTYLLPRLERSFEAAQTFVDAIDGAALAQRRRITIPLVRDVFATLAGAGHDI